MGGLFSRTILVLILSGGFGFDVLDVHSAGLIIQGQIDLNGRNILVDSYDSTDSTRSTDGLYDAVKAGDYGDVICNLGITNSLALGDALIFGRVYSSAGAPMGLGLNGKVGTHVWQSSDDSGIESDYLWQNVAFKFPSVSLPDYSGFLGPVIPGGTIRIQVDTNSFVTNYYDQIICGNYYTTNRLVGHTFVSCPSILVVPNGFAMSGGDTLTVAQGASLKLFVGGGNCTISEKIVSFEPKPVSLVIYCASNVPFLTIKGGQLVATVIAPDSGCVLNGATNLIEDFSGALVAGDLKLNGDVRIHFDESLVPTGILPPAPSAAAYLTVPRLLSPDQFQFQVDGVPGLNYAVESSTNLSDWLPIVTNVAPFLFSETNGTRQSFYRASYRP